MKCCFIINPVAGSRDSSKELIPEIHRAAMACGIPENDYSIHLTNHPAHARELAAEAARAAAKDGESVYIYAAGGDGRPQYVPGKDCAGPSRLPGRHFKDGQIVPEYRDVIEHFPARSVEVKTVRPGQSIIVNVDGECGPDTDLTAEAVPQSARIVLPAKVYARQKLTYQGQNRYFPTHSCHLFYNCIFQYANSLYFALDHIAHVQEFRRVKAHSYARRCSGGDKCSGFQCHSLTQFHDGIVDAA